MNNPANVNEVFRNLIEYNMNIVLREIINL